MGKPLQESTQERLPLRARGRIEADAVVEPVRPIGEGGLDRPGIIGDAKEAHVLSEQRWHPKMRFGRHWFHDRPPALAFGAGLH